MNVPIRVTTPSDAGLSRRSFAQALNDATRQAMELEPGVFVFGIGADGKGGIFGSTTGLVDQFGPRRVFDTPSSESALTALATGAANAGLRPVLVHQRVEFALYSMDQIANWVSLWRFKSGGLASLPLTIRLIVGKGWGQGPQHTKSLHAWFAQLPGLQVVMPSSPSEAKGLLLSAIFSNNPTIVIEGRNLYSMEEEIPDAPYFIAIGKAFVRRPGRDVTLVSFGSMIPQALRAANDVAERGIETEVVDLRSVSPIDMELIEKSVARTGRLVVAEPGWQRNGVAGEIVAEICERLGTRLVSSPRRIAWPDSHVPMSTPMEAAFYPTEQNIADALIATVA